MRRSVLEFQLINHPVDCPVCDQSGECWLQDYYFEYSRQPSRLMEEKVHKPKAVRIGPNVMLDAERCVECTRCIRFCDEITKTHEMTMEDRSDHSTIAIYPRCQLGNPYSLCTVDLCPVGALTSADFRFKKRVWFLTSTSSICNWCSTGCNIFIDSHDGIVYRYRPRENSDVNGPWLCDAGRLSYKQIHADNRVIYPLIIVDDEFKRVSWDEAILKIQEIIEETKPEEIAGVLSARATVEENEAFASFLREKIKTTKLYWSGLDSDFAFGDQLIRDADRNPNVRGVTKITENRLDKMPAAKGFFILDGVTEDELLRIISSRPHWIVLIASHLPLPLCKPVPSEVEGGESEGVDRYSEQSLPSLALPPPQCIGGQAYKGKGLFCIILPKATFAEQSGTFVNRKGMRQRFEKAIEPRGESLPGAEIAKRLNYSLSPGGRGPG
jgi:NADH-quinone oxidoreductase subunit G